MNYTVRFTAFLTVSNGLLLYIVCYILCSSSFAHLVGKQDNFLLLEDTGVCVCSVSLVR